MRAIAVALLVLAGCRKDAPAPVATTLKPGELTVDGAYHAVGCGAVTAIWSGNAEALAQLPQPAPKTFGVESLAFKFADGTSKGFAPLGQVFFNDWRFDIFSPDCSKVALQTDHFGPYHVVKTEQLKAYLEGKAMPLVVKFKSTEALVHGDLHWRDNESFDFVASGGGAAYGVVASAVNAQTRVVLEAKQAPKGLRRAGDGFEVIP